MSEKPNEDSMNIYDRITEEMREKQRENQRIENERKQGIADMLEQQNSKTIDRFKGENR